MDLRYEAIARNLNILLGTAYNIFKLFESTGEVDPNKKPRRDHKLDDHHALYIVGLVLNFPALQLSELVDKVAEVSGTVVSTSRLPASHGLSRKKIQHVALQRRLDLGGSFVASTYPSSRNMFVYIDETGCKVKNMLRQYGYALCGDRAVSHQLLVRGQNITAIAAICTTGSLALEIHRDKVNGDIFFDFARGSLIPELLPFDGYNHQSIVIMDNCSIHRVQDVVELFNSVGVLVLYLPPYSPDLNPIELTFSNIYEIMKESYM